MTVLNSVTTLKKLTDCLVGGFCSKRGKKTDGQILNTKKTQVLLVGLGWLPKDRSAAGQHCHSQQGSTITACLWQCVLSEKEPMP